MSTFPLPFEDVAGPGFAFHEIVRGHGILVGRIPDALLPDADAFEELWKRHPAESTRILIHGRLVPAPRWNRAFGHAYELGEGATAVDPVPSHLVPFLQWAQGAVDPRLNGVGVNWYDARLGHYIGPHRDHRQGLLYGTPLVTISLGEERPFRVRPWKGRGYTDFASPPGTVFVISYAANLVITHEVPLLAAHRNRRISLTLRGYAGAG